MLIILACSKKKLTVDKAKAGELYTGEIFKKGKKIALYHNIPYMILSARYGLVTPEEILENYDEKLKKPYQGPWPIDFGFYLGGQLYFKNAPKNYQSLTIAKGLGYMLQELNTLIQNPDMVTNRINDLKR